MTIAALAAALAVAGLLVGCGGSDDNVATIDPATSVETTDATATTSTDFTTAATDPPSTDAPDEPDAPDETDPPAPDSPAPDSPSPVTQAPAGDEGECLVGDWVVTEDQMNAFYSGLMSTLEAPIGIDAAGSASLSFAADGTYRWAPDFALTVEVAGQRGTGVTDGTIIGDWSAAGGVVTTSSDINALAVAIEVNGVTFGGDDLVDGLFNSSPINGVTYRCDGPTPVLDFKTGDPAVTVPITFASA